ncbi:MAG: phosphoribosylformylglycinamidine cyclo-ligase [Synechococcales cyanobacterium CRU_2_2]|nr:phosphoribosylformylglycinamidine cyclo-ligase [Synechococcales cyanobacterium CRU_2_2]
MDYRAAGVDVEAGRQFVSRIKDIVAATYRSGVLGGLGGFGGLFELPTGYRQPVLVSGTDGVGTKLKLAHQLDCHETVGIDLVAMCVNDVLTCGAEPLFFLDYIATGKLNEAQLAAVVSGIAAGCQASGCALLGGETAEMPGFYGPGEYDLAGFCVGIVEKSEILDGSRVQLGDVAIALPSSGVHSNGYSLVRKIIETQNLSWTDMVAAFDGHTLGEVFLAPTQLYVQPVLAALKQDFAIHAMAHNTGGGLPENLPRCLGADQSVQIDLASWERPKVFQWLEAAGQVSRRVMFETFNMGVGYVVIVPQGVQGEAIAFFRAQGLAAWQLGTVVPGHGEVLGLPL